MKLSSITLTLNGLNSCVSFFLGMFIQCHAVVTSLTCKIWDIDFVSLSEPMGNKAMTDNGNRRVKQIIDPRSILVLLHKMRTFDEMRNKYNMVFCFVVLPSLLYGSQFS